MPLFVATVHFADMYAGEIVEIPDAEIDDWADEIEHDPPYLIPVDTP